MPAPSRRRTPAIAPALRALCRADLIRDEGLRLKPYHCSAGKLTIGVGYNLDDRGREPLESIIGRPLRILGAGITHAEAMVLLDADIDMAVRDARIFAPTFAALNEVRQRVLINFLFNLGLTRARKFVKLRAALERGDFADAAQQLTLSLWARQVGDGPGKYYDRAERLADMMRTGTDPGR